MEYKNYQEYLKHPKFRTIRKQAMSKANYTCQDCQRAKATEVHHIQYPKWGEFDVVENLIPLCHKCHCKRHDKDS